MPRKGSKTITVTEKKHLEAIEITRKLGITLKEYIESLIGTIPQSYAQNIDFHLLKEVPPIE